MCNAPLAYEVSKCPRRVEPGDEPLPREHGQAVVAVGASRGRLEDLKDLVEAEEPSDAGPVPVAFVPDVVDDSRLRSAGEVHGHHIALRELRFFTVHPPRFPARGRVSFTVFLTPSRPTRTARPWYAQAC